MNVAQRQLLSVVTLVNDVAAWDSMRVTLAAAARRTRSRLEWHPIDADGLGLNAAAGLNRGLAAATGRWVICVHQDVRFPVDWCQRFEDQCQRWARVRGRLPAVAGTVGIRPNGRFAGAVCDPHGFGVWSRRPRPAVSLDEHLLVLDSSRGQRFDEHGPGFHGYGTDLALQTRALGLDAITMRAAVLHRSPGERDASFDAAGTWLLSKWGERLGGCIPTCAQVIVDPNHSSRKRRVQMIAARHLSIRGRKWWKRLYGNAEESRLESLWHEPLMPRDAFALAPRQNTRLVFPRPIAVAAGDREQRRAA